MVDDDRVQFIGELPRLAVSVAVGDDPFQLNLAIRGRLENLDVHIPSLREVVNGKPREHGFGSDDIECRFLSVM